MIVRPATAADEKEIYRLVCLLENLVLPETAFAAVFEKNIHSQDVFYFVAEEEHKVIGFAGLHIQYLLHHAGRVAELQEICVTEESRNKNTGSKLLEQVIATARKHQCELIEVSANKVRTKAHHFYQKNGFSASHFKFTLNLK